MTRLLDSWITDNADLAFHATIDIPIKITARIEVIATPTISPISTVLKLC